MTNTSPVFIGHDYLQVIGWAVTASLTPRGIQVVGRIPAEGGIPTTYVAGHSLPACTIVGVARDGRWYPVSKEGT